MKIGYSQSEVEWWGFGQEATFDLLANRPVCWDTRQQGEIVMFESDPESMVLLQTPPTASVWAPHHSGQERGDCFSFFFFLQREKKHTHCLNKVLTRSKIGKKKTKDCILTGILNKHKEIIQCGTNKIVFTYSMYCQWPITHCLQKMSHSFDMIPA